MGICREVSHPPTVATVGNRGSLSPGWVRDLGYWSTAANSRHFGWGQGGPKLSGTTGLSCSPGQRDRDAGQGARACATWRGWLPPDPPYPPHTCRPVSHQEFPSCHFPPHDCLGAIVSAPATPWCPAPLASLFPGTKSAPHIPGTAHSLPAEPHPDPSVGPGLTPALAVAPGLGPVWGPW